MKSSPLLLLFFLGLAHAAPAPDKNLVVNPSFEQAAAEGVLVEDWRTTRHGIPVERRADGGRTGEAFVRFLDDDPGGAGSSNPAACPPDPAAATTPPPPGCAPRTRAGPGST